MNTSPAKKRVSVNKPTVGHLKSDGLAYEKDFYKWTRTQANLLKTQEFEKLDIKHLMEEIESLGNSEKRALESHIANLFLHLLKIEHQPSMRSKSWDNFVKNAKFQITKLLKANPSLKSKLSQLSEDAYFTARLNASSETGLDENVFPIACPWKISDLLSNFNAKA